MAYEDEQRYGGRREYGRENSSRYGEQRRGDPRDRDFFERAGDEVRSWFGDQEAERRRALDEEYDERSRDRDRNYGRGDRYGSPSGEGYGNDRSGWTGGYSPRSGQEGGYSRDYRSRSSSGGYEGGSSGRDFGASDYGRRDEGSRSYGRSGASGFGRSQGSDYGRSSFDRERSRGGYFGDDHEHAGYQSWRGRQLDQFDRDYDEYRRENHERFASEFGSWRQNRQTQRDSLNKVKEHQEVVGSDGAHVGTVDHVRGDRILLTRKDANAGGHHHSIPSSWIKSVEDKVTLSKTAAEAQQAWRDEESNSGVFGREGKGSDAGGRDDKSKAEPTPSQQSEKRDVSSGQNQ